MLYVPGNCFIWQITGGADGSIRASHLTALQGGGADNLSLNAASWEVLLPENRKPQSIVLTDDVTAIVLTTTGLVMVLQGGLFLKVSIFMDM